MLGSGGVTLGEHGLWADGITGQPLGLGAFDLVLVHPGRQCARVDTQISGDRRHRLSESTATERALQTSRIRSSLSRPRRSTSTPIPTLSTASGLTAYDDRSTEVAELHGVHVIALT